MSEAPNQQSAERRPATERDEELWKKAQEAFPIPEKPSLEEMKKKQGLINDKKRKSVEAINGIASELRELRSKLFPIVAPPDFKSSLAIEKGGKRDNEKKFYKFVCNGRAKEIIKVPAKRMAERNAPDKRDRMWRSLSETVGDFPRSFYP